MDPTIMQLGVVMRAVWLILGLSTVLLAACQPQAGRTHLAADEKIQITRSVWDNFTEYKRVMGPGGGAFVVSESGLASAYSYCPAVRCRPGSSTHQAISLCQNAGVKCVVFAQGNSIVVDYEIVD